jgi:hypothetical protein
VEYCYDSYSYLNLLFFLLLYLDENSVIVFFCVHVVCLVPNFRTFHLLVSFSLKPL